MMGTLILNAAQGSVRATAGGLIGHAVGSLFGGGPIGSMFGHIAGQAFSGALTDHRTRLRDGPRLHDMPVMGATEGTPIPKVYGRARLGGTLIWATRFAEPARVVRLAGMASRVAVAAGQLRSTGPIPITAISQ